MGRALRKGFYWRGGIVWVRTDALDRVPRSTGRKDPAAAYLWHAERERIAADPVHAASLTASLGEWVLKTIARKKADRAEGTASMYSVKLGHFVRLWGKDAPLAGIDANAVDEYIDQRRAEGAKNNTIARELTCLRQLLRMAKRGKCFAGDLAAVMPVAFSADYEPVKRTLAPADLPKLWAALRNDNERAWVALALSTAADPSDIERAQPSDYDAARDVFMLHGTKTATRAAEVPVLAHVRELFEYALARLPVSWSRASKGIGEACARAGIPHLSPKDLRRTAASWLIATGAQQQHVSRFLRHRNDAMVRMVYGQMKPEELGALLAPSAETLQSITRPLGGTAYAGDLKGDAGGGTGGSPLDGSRSYAREESPIPTGDSAETLQRRTVAIPALEALTLAADAVLIRRAGTLAGAFIRRRARDVG